jgi:hypothetical protein
MDRRSRFSGMGIEEVSFQAREKLSLGERIVGEVIF